MRQSWGEAPQTGAVKGRPLLALALVTVGWAVLRAGGWIVAGGAPVAVPGEGAFARVEAVAPVVPASVPSAPILLADRPGLSARTTPSRRLCRFRCRPVPCRSRWGRRSFLPKPWP